ncbi:MFS transporter [Massilia forsythiae]|uniref:MFS transporter n=1 Tax=Massilia forsythiae TaxID=2728020 RepID=A0A7Z2VZC3_9BURK|nr:MFS transporter [Massilia forsythiae]QJE02198.1 MFS transporter [Massilia forsythiae]
MAVSSDEDYPVTLAHDRMPTWLMLLIAAACGLIVANIYYAQPLVGPIRAAIGLPAEAAGLIVTLTQLGYGAGLLLAVPLGDLVENRRLVLGLMGVLGLALLGAMFARQAAAFLACSLAIGFGAVAVQVLVPYASHMAAEEERGRVVGNIVSGLMLGIMLARPVASFLAHLVSWQAVYGLSVLLMALLALVLRLLLPARVPPATLGYAALLGSMGGIVARFPVLRRRALYQAGMFGAFSVFWTVTPLLLSGPAFGLDQSGIALFALAGVAGAVAAPIAGRVADRGWTRPATAFCIAVVIAAFGATLATAHDGASMHARLALLTLAAVVLDFGVSGNLVLGQRAIYALGAEVRSRVNGIYMATFFLGGAAGSALGAWAYARAGWGGACAVGMALPALALLLFLSERRATVAAPVV